MLDLLRKIPPRWIGRLLFIFAPLAVLQRALLGTMQGALFCSVSLYWYMEVFGEAKPLSTSQLVLWLAELSVESKTGLATSLITVVGFVVAFRTATLNWKEQTRTTLRIAIADEIERFFDEVARRTIDAQLYAEAVVAEVTRIQASRLNPTASGVIDLLIQDGPKFRENRQRLVSLSIEVHRLGSKHYTLLAPLGGVLKALEDCVTSFRQITTEMWVQVPTITPDHPNPHTSFIDQIDVAKWNSFAACCERNYHIIDGLIGGIRGALLAPLAELTPSALTSVLGMRARFEQALADVRHRSKEEV